MTELTDLGDLGTVRVAEDPLSFGYFGKVYRTNPGITDLGLVDLVDDLVGAAEAKSVVQALAIFRNMMRTLIHPDDVDALWATAKENRQTVEDIGDLCEQIIEAVADRPTVQPSESSDGLPTTGQNSSVGSSSQAIDLLERQGRPDLALVVTRAAEFMASA